MATETATAPEVALLEPHARRTLRAFLKLPDKAPEVGAFWTVIYGRTVVTHATAQAVALECSTSGSYTVQDVLDGWKPTALKVTQ